MGGAPCLGRCGVRRHCVQPAASCVAAYTSCICVCQQALLTESCPLAAAAGAGPGQPPRQGGGGVQEGGGGADRRRAAPCWGPRGGDRRLNCSGKPPMRALSRCKERAIVRHYPPLSFSCTPVAPLRHRSVPAAGSPRYLWNRPPLLRALVAAAPWLQAAPGWSARRVARDGAALRWWQVSPSLRDLLPGCGRAFVEKELSRHRSDTGRGPRRSAAPGRALVVRRRPGCFAPGCTSCPVFVLRLTTAPAGSAADYRQLLVRNAS